MSLEKGQIAIISLISSLLSCLLCENLAIPLLKTYFNHSNVYWIHLVNFTLFFIFIKCFYQKAVYEISIRAYFLGYTLCLGALFYITGLEQWRIIGVYIVVLCTFHFSEFLAIAYTNPSALSPANFMIYHSPAYTIAAAASWTEFIVEVYYFPEFKKGLYMPLIGLILCLTGEILRKTAIFTAKQNFNHIIQNKKADDHQLITSGVYRLCRHPSYVGWFYWSIGTQLILQNPLCIIAYPIISWIFFYERIMIEEMSLIRFFGTSYLEYQEKVGTGLPFIVGYKL